MQFEKTLQSETTQSETRSETARPPTSPRRAIGAATIGNLLETYDFAVYGYFAVTISHLFFPSGDETASLLATVAAFGVGFVMRPVGAVVLGTLADRSGRKAALSATILLMAAGTAMIGLAPTYAAIGAWAPAIIVVARLVQGFSAGGEVGTATVFLAEHAPPGRRGLFASWQQASQACGLLLGSLVGAAMAGMLSQAAMESWGWRVPFLLGLLIGPVGFYLRTRTSEPEEYVRAVAERRDNIGGVVGGSTLAAAVVRHRRGIVTGFGITITWTVCTYFFLVYLPTYAQRELHLGQAEALLATSACLVLVLVLAPVFGALSDRIGRRGLLITSAAAVVVLTYPALALLSAYPTVWSLLAFQVGFAVVIAAFTGPAPAAMAEVCPADVRSTSVSIAYNLAVALFGGFAPFIATWLIASTGDALSPAWYVAAACALSVAMISGLYSHREARVAATN